MKYLLIGALCFIGGFGTAKYLESSAGQKAAHNAVQSGATYADGLAHTAVSKAGEVQK